MIEHIRDFEDQRPSPRIPYPGGMPSYPVPPGYQERFGDPTKVISGLDQLPPSLNAPDPRQVGPQDLGPPQQEAYLGSFIRPLLTMAGRAVGRGTGKVISGAAKTGTALAIGNEIDKMLRGPPVPDGVTDVTEFTNPPSPGSVPSGATTKPPMPSYRAQPSTEQVETPTEQAAAVAAARMRQAVAPPSGRQMGPFSEALAQQPNVVQGLNNLDQNVWNALPESVKVELRKMFLGPPQQ